MMICFDDFNVMDDIVDRRARELVQLDLCLELANAVDWANRCVFEEIRLPGRTEDYMDDKCDTLSYKLLSPNEYRLDDEENAILYWTMQERYFGKRDIGKRDLEKRDLEKWGPGKRNLVLFKHHEELRGMMPYDLLLDYEHPTLWVTLVFPDYDFLLRFRDEE